MTTEAPDARGADREPAADPRVQIDPWARPSLPPAAPLLANPPTYRADDTQPIPAVPAGVTGVSPPDTAERGRWSLVDAFVGFGVLLLLSEIIGFLARSAGQLSAIGSIWLGSAPVWLALVGTAVWAARRHGTGNVFRDFGLKLRPIDLLIGVGLGLGYRIASGVIVLIVSNLFGQTPKGNLDVIVGSGSGVVFNISLVLTSAVIAPVVEELFFRGVVLRSGLATLQRRPTSRWSRTRTRATWSVTGISAGMFMLAHLSEISGLVTGLSLALTLLMVGGVNALISLRTGRIGSAVIAHMVFNGVAVAFFVSS